LHVGLPRAGEGRQPELSLVTARRLGHIPHLDGVRGVAILMVVAQHTLHRRGGLTLGVDVFFVLSGFLITSLLLSEQDRDGRISLRGFYRRRAFRLMPALYAQLATLLLVVAALAIAGRAGHLPSQLLAAAGTASIYVGNLAAAFHVPVQMPHRYEYYWSLAQEEQFYLLWPALLIWLLIRRRRLWIYLIPALVAGLSGALQITLWLNGASRDRLWLAPDTHLAPIALGCLAGVAYTYASLPLRTLRVLTPLALVTCVAIVSVPPLDYRRLYEGPAVVFGLACAICVLATCSGAAGWLAKPLSARPLRWTGKVSYSLYLWNIPLLAAFGLLGLPLSFLAAALSRRYIEEPFLRLKRRPARTVPVPQPA
jgi:peptidoglycan/LPS O-acetylase OafA/YrhL